jgi:hypothetical protein
VKTYADMTVVIARGKASIRHCKVLINKLMKSFIKRCMTDFDKGKLSAKFDKLFWMLRYFYFMMTSLLIIKFHNLFLMSIRVLDKV